MKSTQAHCPICPICLGALPAEPNAAGKQAKYLPFCSSRCKTIDLGNWLGERYAVPGGRVIDADDSADQDGGKDPRSGGDLGR